MIIGKSKKPTGFKNVNISSLPVYYRNQKSAWDEEQLASGEIKAYFLLPNVTSLLQPLDQDALENLKLNYRKKLLGKLIEDLEEQRATECLK
ncbi:hypothetical protein AVEN_19785-1 [Araneus ventricosus]|uniref:DDE-1 domain-containing protein n=1 Tax=Araneus ventricosus TaxID=182803 RepID=A0A4Y2HBX7_ARAVE|nr:hypothetical protein AVEN_19785-1 [Araneus ventricosus]